MEFKYIKHYTYEQLDKAVEDILTSAKVKRIYLSFSIYETVNDEETDLDKIILEAPDFNKPTGLEGACTFSRLFTVWKIGKRGEMPTYSKKKATSKIYNNPTWSDILKEANKCGFNDHHFLEDIELENTVNGIKHYNFFFGS